MTTPNLQLPEVPRAILGASDELNDAFWSLDAIVQLAVKDKDLTTPPLDATQGDRFIVPSGAIGSWAGRDRAIAYLGPNGYLFYPPRPGWRARVLDEEAWYVYTDNAEWELEVSGGGGSTVSPLTTKGDLYTHDGSANARLPVGSNSQVLTADATATTGQRWKTRYFLEPVANGDSDDPEMVFSDGDIVTVPVELE